MIRIFAVFFVRAFIHTFFHSYLFAWALNYSIIRSMLSYAMLRCVCSTIAIPTTAYIPSYGNVSLCYATYNNICFVCFVCVCLYINGIHIHSQWRRCCISSKYWTWRWSHFTVYFAINMFGCFCWCLSAPIVQTMEIYIFLAATFPYQFLFNSK